MYTLPINWLYRAESPANRGRSVGHLLPDAARDLQRLLEPTDFGRRMGGGEIQLRVPRVTAQQILAQPHRLGVPVLHPGVHVEKRHARGHLQVCAGFRHPLEFLEPQRGVAAGSTRAANGLTSEGSLSSAIWYNPRPYSASTRAGSSR